MNGTDITKILSLTCRSLAAQYTDKGISYFIGVNGSPCCDPRHGIFSLQLKKLGIKTTVSFIGTRHPGVGAT